MQLALVYPAAGWYLITCYQSGASEINSASLGRVMIYVYTADHPVTRLRLREVLQDLQIRPRKHMLDRAD